MLAQRGGPQQNYHFGVRKERTGCRLSELELWWHEALVEYLEREGKVLMALEPRQPAALICDRWLFPFLCQVDRFFLPWAVDDTVGKVLSPEAISPLSKLFQPHGREATKRCRLLRVWPSSPAPAYNVKCPYCYTSTRQTRASAPATTAAAEICSRQTPEEQGGVPKGRLERSPSTAAA